MHDSTVAVVVGDIVDHGLTAAANMALIRGVATTLLHDGVAVGDVFARVSRILHRRPEDLLATASLVTVHVAAQRLAYSNVGHPPPLVVTGSGDVIVLDRANTPMLGIGREHKAAATVRLRPAARY